MEMQQNVYITLTFDKKLRRIMLNVLFIWIWHHQSGWTFPFAIFFVNLHAIAEIS